MIKINKKIRKQLIYLIGSIMILIFLAIFMRQVISIVFITIFILIGGLSKLYIRFTNIPLGFELITPLTILFAYKTNPFFAIFAAIVMLFLASIFMGKFDFPGMIMEIGIYFVISILAFILNSISFTIIAVILIILRNIIIFPTATLFLGRNPAQIGFAVIVNTIVNIFLILSIGNIIINIL